MPTSEQKRDLSVQDFKRKASPEDLEQYKRLKGHDAKSAFRKQWDAGRAVNVVATKRNTQVEGKMEGSLGVYRPRSVMIQKEGNDAEAAIAVDKIISKALAKGYPWCAMNPDTERLEFLHRKRVPTAGPSPFPVCRMRPPPAEEGAPPANGAAAAAQAPAAAFAPPPLAPAAEADLLGEGPPAPAPAVPAAAQAPVGDLLGMDDWLGGADPAPPPAQTAAPFGLAHGARMDGADFEARWGRLPAGAAQSR
ncbi:unnamed protein product, partial [Prorocentrum cordatum]